MPVPPVIVPPWRPLRLAVVGLGHRAGNFLKEIAAHYGGEVSLVGFCDRSRIRAETQARWLAERHGLPAIPCYIAADFARLLAEQRPDTVLVATVDATHHHYIAAAVAAGCDVITEKPLATDVTQLRAIFAATAAHPDRRVTVAFNYRWAPSNTRIRQLLAQRTIGRVLSINFEWLLDTAHGADYFRRWHSDRAHSGGLLVHKATHHFDLVNWWLGDTPVSVFAQGGLMFYGRDAAVARGEAARTTYARYADQPAAAADPFRLDLKANDRFRELYLAAEAESGYIRDRNVFRAGIDIEDQASVLVRYRGGAQLTYSLSAFSPREGARIAFNGDCGRIEYYLFEKSPPSQRENDEGHTAPRTAEGAVRRLDTERSFIRVYPHFAPAYDVPVENTSGGHWGGDPLMWRQLFSRQPPAELLGRVAGLKQGAASALVGIAANQSIATGRMVALSELMDLSAAGE